MTRCAASLCVSVALCLLAGTVHAQVRSGGGSIQRTGPAMGGPMQPAHPAPQPTPRLGTPTTLGGALRPDQRPLPDTRTAAEKIDQARRETLPPPDPRDFDSEGGRAYYYRESSRSGRYTVIDDASRKDWPALAPRLEVGTTLTSPAFRSMQSDTRCPLSEVSVEGVLYHRCGDTWFSRVMDGWNVNYVVVRPPEAQPAR